MKSAVSGDAGAGPAIAPSSPGAEWGKCPRVSAKSSNVIWQAQAVEGWAKQRNLAKKGPNAG